MARILAVDDSPAMRRMVSVTLRSAGHDVMEAFAGRDALDERLLATVARVVG